jgi:hypothetical protein
MAFLDFAGFDATPLVREPFAFVVVPNFVRPEFFASVLADFPKVPGPGSFPLEALEIRGAFQALLGELDSLSFQQAVERKFAIDLADRPKMISVRGHARRKDGAIHTDTATKLISVLLYMNEDWVADGGRLLLLRSPSLDEPIVEVPPAAGTLVAFQRSNRSWHGHKPFFGPRRVIQFNWMTTNDVVLRERGRHLATAYWKKLAGVFYASKS